MMSKRCVLRRQWNIMLILVVLVAYVFFSCILYMYFVKLLETTALHSMLFVDGFKTRIKDDIFNLGVDLDEIEFQDEESIRPPFSEFLHHNLIDNAVDPVSITNQLNTTTKKGKRKDRTCFKSDYEFDNGDRSASYLFVFGHYEQLGKTTINLLHSGLLAAGMNRNLVIPFVRNSRFCGLQSGWTGPKRKLSREFLPMDNYFNMRSVEHIFREHVFNKQGAAMLSTLPQFYDACLPTGITIIFFMYAGSKAECKRYMMLSEEIYIDIHRKMRGNRGWTDCLFVEDKLKITKKINNMKVNRALCVDPEIIRSEKTLEGLLHTSKCVTVFLWRGVGFQRTHFNLTLPKSHESYLSHLQFSQFVIEEVHQFVQSMFGGKEYLSIHIRSERQLIWYSLEKFKKCLNLVVKIANILIKKKKVGYIFISSDLEKHGSDSLSQLLNITTLNATKSFYWSAVGSLNVLRYKPDKRKGIIYNDAGFVALTEMEIMARSSHLITLGAGTFQGWLVAMFKKYQNLKKNPWSLTRVCSVEIKNANARHKKNIP